MRFEARASRSGRLEEVSHTTSPSTALEAYLKQERPPNFWLAPEREDRVQLSIAARAMQAASKRAADPRELTQLRIDVLRLLVERLTGRPFVVTHIEALGPMARLQLAGVGRVELPPPVEPPPVEAPPVAPPVAAAVEGEEAAASGDAGGEAGLAEEVDGAEEIEEVEEVEEIVEEVVDAAPPPAELEESAVAEADVLAFAAGAWIQLTNGQEIPVGVELVLRVSFLEQAGMSLDAIAEMDDRFDLQYPGSDVDIDYADLFYEIDMDGVPGEIDQLIGHTAPPPALPVEPGEVPVEAEGPPFAWAQGLQIWETDGDAQRVLILVASAQWGGLYLDRRLQRRAAPVEEAATALSPLLFGPIASRYGDEKPRPTWTRQA